MKKAYIYWLHLPEHYNYSEGYIGVSVNPIQRLKQHKRKILKNSHLKQVFKKYGNKVQLNVIWIGEEESCYKIEKELRPEKNIGWNIAEGGDKPPSQKGKNWNHSEETKQKMRKPKSNTLNMGSKKGCVPWNKGLSKELYPNLARPGQAEYFKK